MAGQQDPKGQGGKPGEDTSGLIDLLELAATEKKTQTGKHPAVGRTPAGGSRGVGDTGRRSVIRVPTPGTGESKIPASTATTGRNGAVVRMTPPTGTPAVAPPAPAPAAAQAAPRSKLPLILGGVAAAALVVGGYLALAPKAPAPEPAKVAAPAPPAPTPAPAPVKAEPAAPAPEAAKPVEPEKVAAVEPEGDSAAKAPRAKDKTKAEPVKVAKTDRPEKAEPVKADKPEPAKVEAKAKTDDPFPAKAKAEEPPKTEEARLAGEAVKKEKKGGKSDELSAVLSGKPEEGGGEKPAAAKEDATPEKLSMADLRKGMGPVTKRALDCYEKHQVAGTAQVKLTVEPSGKVSGASVLGSYAGTPTGQCLLDAVNKASFPKSKSAFTTTYPFMLR